MGMGTVFGLYEPEASATDKSDRSLISRHTPCAVLDFGLDAFPLLHHLSVADASGSLKKQL